MFFRCMNRLGIVIKRQLSISVVVLFLMGLMFVENTGLVMLGEETEPFGQFLASSQAVLNM